MFKLCVFSLHVKSVRPSVAMPFAARYSCSISVKSFALLHFCNNIECWRFMIKCKLEENALTMHVTACHLYGVRDTTGNIKMAGRCPRHWDNHY